MCEYDSYYWLYHYRIDLHRTEVKIESVMLYHSVTEHLPEDIAAKLCQCGVDEQVLLLQCLGKWTARTGVLFFDSGILYQLCDDLQRWYGLVNLRSRLLYLLWDTTQYDLSRCLRVAEVKPIQRCLMVCVVARRYGLEDIPKVYSWFDVIRTGDSDIGKMFLSSIFHIGGIECRQGLPVIPEEVVDACYQAIRLIQSQVGIPEELSSYVGFSYNIGII